MALRGISFICIRLMMILTVNFPFFWLTQSTRGNVAAGHCKKMKVSIIKPIRQAIVMHGICSYYFHRNWNILCHLSLFSLQIKAGLGQANGR